jgi:MFS family permease
MVLRFITGVGLAGEIGGAITLVSEVLSKERRGIGTAIVATAGAIGAVVASYTVTLIPWRSLYIIGGVMGLVLLALRLATAESRFFESVKGDSTVKKGSLCLLVTDRGRLARLLALIAIGLPHYFSWAIVATFSPEIAEASIGRRISAALPLSYFALGIAVGDIFCGLFSQLLRSRKKVIGIFLISQGFCIFGALHLNGYSERLFTLWFLPLGFFCGLWSVLITSASEQYGTNLRSTVSSIVPNAIRGCTVPLSIAFLSCKESFGLVSAVQIVGCSALLLAFIGLKIIRESFGISLNYIEVTRGQRDYDGVDSSGGGNSGSAEHGSTELPEAGAVCQKSCLTKDCD